MRVASTSLSKSLKESVGIYCQILLWVHQQIKVALSLHFFLLATASYQANFWWEVTHVFNFPKLAFMWKIANKLLLTTSWQTITNKHKRVHDGKLENFHLFIFWLKTTSSTCQVCESNGINNTDIENSRGAAVWKHHKMLLFLALAKAFNTVCALRFPEVNCWLWVALSYLSFLSLIVC